MILSLRCGSASLMIVLALVLITSACGGGYSSPGGSHAKPLTGISLYAAAAPSIPSGGTVKLIAYGTYGDPAGADPYKDVSGTATWSSSDEAVATVTRGQVTGAGVGSVAITAKLEGYSATTNVIVGLTPTIVITPDGTGTFNLSHPQRQFYAIATYSDNTVLSLTDYVTWSASPPGVMKFDDYYGLFPGLATFTSTGTATITATLREGEEATLTVNVEP